MTNYIQIIVKEINRIIKYKNIDNDIFIFSKIFSDKINILEENFIKNCRLKTYIIRYVLDESLENKNFFCTFESEKKPMGFFVLKNFDKNITESIKSEFFKIILKLVPTDYSIYFMFRKKSSVNELNEYLNSKEIYKEEISKDEIVFECLNKDFNKIYNIFSENSIQPKVFIMRKYNFFYLHNFYDDDCDDSCPIELFNNIYCAFEVLPFEEGIIVFTNKINNLEFFVDSIYLNSTNKKIAKLATFDPG